MKRLILAAWILLCWHSPVSAGVLILKQSTSVVVSFGPFVDKTDAVTLKTGMVTAIDHATTGILLSKNGGALTIRSQSVTASTYDAYGNYRVTLSTTDTNTVGTLTMSFAEPATCLGVWQNFMVVPANQYGVDWDGTTGILTVPKNVIYSNFTFEMVDQATGQTPTAGLTVTCNVSKDGAALAACTNSVSEIGSGLYKTNVAAADLNADEVWLKFTATGGRRVSFKIRPSR